LKKWHFSFAPPVKLEVAIKQRPDFNLEAYWLTSILCGIPMPAKPFERDTLDRY